MDISSHPRVTLGIVLAIFALVFVVSLYSPAFYAVGGANNTHILVVTPVSYWKQLIVHHSQSASSSAKFTGLQYNATKCVYHD